MTPSYNSIRVSGFAQVKVRSCHVCDYSLFSHGDSTRGVPLSHNSSRHSVTSTCTNLLIRSTMKLHLHLTTLLLLSSAPGAAIASNLRAAAGLHVEDRADRALQGDNTNPDADDPGLSKLDPDDLGFVWKLWPSKKFSDRGEDYGVMCRGKECDKKDHVVTGHINNNLDYMRWEYVPHPKVESAGQMKTKSKDLCLAHNKDHDYVLDRCDDADEDQLFVGFSHTEKFKLHPYGRGKNYDNHCITMLHRPRSNGDDDGEIIIDQSCEKPLKTETAYWIAQYRPRIEEEIGTKDKKCKKNDKCGECEGDCDSDSDCKGKLECFERNENGWRYARDNKGVHPNPWAEIPGCKGYGSYGRDYCYDPKKDRNVDFSK